MNISNSPLVALVGHWLGKISPSHFAILSFIYWKATSSPDGKVGEPIAGIATATGLSVRTVQPGLRELASVGAIQILSMGKERMLVEIPRQYLNPSVKTSGTDSAPATIPELIFRLCGHRPSPQMLTIMRAAAKNDEQRLHHCLDSFFTQGKSWTTIELLTVAVQYDLRTPRLLDGCWGRGSFRDEGTI